jgi:hypothetical protein
MSPSSLPHRLQRVATILLSLTLLLLPVLTSAQGGGGSTTAGCPNPLKLLEPLPDGTTQFCPSSNPFGVVNAYLRPMLAFMIGIAAGLAVLMVMIGGLQIIMSNGDSGKIGEGKKRITEAILGLLLLVFSGAILYFLNSYFFQLV